MGWACSTAAIVAMRKGSSTQSWMPSEHARVAGSTVEDCVEVTGHATPAMFKRYADLFTDEGVSGVRFRSSTNNSSRPSSGLLRFRFQPIVEIVPVFSSALFI